MQDSSPDKSAQAIRLAAMNMLARREHSYHELLLKLSEKYPDTDLDEVIRPALDRLREQGLQSDSRFAEAFVRYRSSRGVGPLKIAAELYPRRLEDSLQREALYDGNIDWFALCEQVWQRKFSPAGRPDLKQKQRWQRFLQQRGFETEHIRHVMALAEELPDSGEA